MKTLKGLLETINASKSPSELFAAIGHVQLFMALEHEERLGVL